MKPTKPLLLPRPAGDKLAAIFGYIVAGVGIILAIMYAVGIDSSCIAENRTGLLRASLFISLIQLVLSIGLILLARELIRHATALYLIGLIAASLIVLIAQLLFAVGYSFAAGTACTT